MARSPDFDEDELGGSEVDYWPSLYGDAPYQPFEIYPPVNPPPPPAHHGEPVFARRDPPLTEEGERYVRLIRQAYNAWLAAGHLPEVLEERSGEAVMAHWKAFRERYVEGAEVVELHPGGKDREGATGP